MKWYLQNDPRTIVPMTGRLAIVLRELERDMLDFSVQGPDSFDHLESDQPCFFYGSTQMCRMLYTDPKWVPHMVNDLSALDQRNWINHRGTDMFNGDAKILKLIEAESWFIGKSFFIRPVEDQKAFAGQIIYDGHFSWLATDRYGRERNLNPDMLVAVSPIKEIVAEWRFVVYDHKIELGSMYRQYNKMNTCGSVPDEIVAEANKLASGWMPAKLIVMDMCLTSDGQYKIMEFNSVHSSGMYDINLFELTALIEKIKGVL